MVGSFGCRQEDSAVVPLVGGAVEGMPGDFQSLSLQIGVSEGFQTAAERLP